MRTPDWRLVFRLGLWVCLAIITFLAFAPMASDPGTGHDKANHILAFLVLAGLADLAYPGPVPGLGWSKSVSLLAYGLFIETVQYFLPYRESSGWDLVADGIGIWLYVAGVWLAMSARAGRTRT